MTAPIVVSSFSSAAKQVRCMVAPPLQRTHTNMYLCSHHTSQFGSAPTYTCNPSPHIHMQRGCWGYTHTLILHNYCSMVCNTLHWCMHRDGRCGGAIDGCVFRLTQSTVSLPPPMRDSGSRNHQTSGRTCQSSEGHSAGTGHRPPDSGGRLGDVCI